MLGFPRKRKDSVRKSEASQKSGSSKTSEKKMKEEDDVETTSMHINKSVMDIFPVTTVSLSSHVDLTHPPLEEMGRMPGYSAATFEPVILPAPAPDEFPKDRPEREIFKRSGHIRREQAEQVMLTHAETLNRTRSRWKKIHLDELTTNDSISSYAYWYTLESFLESRSMVWTSEPYFGGTFASGPRDPPPPWEIKATPPQLFEAGRVDLEVPDTSLIKPCHTCQSLGSDRCDFCFGTGKITCKQCQGTGIRSQFKDGENRRVACGCMGGKMWCIHCKGTGRRRCNECQGRRFLRWFIIVSVSWAVHQDEHVEPGSALNGEELKQATGDVTFEEVYPRVWPITSFSNKMICERSKELVPLHASKFTHEKILMQRQRILTIPVTQVFFSHEDNYFSYFVYGLDHKLHAPDLPQRRLCASCNIL